jgi:hypothetical protein
LSHLFHRFLQASPPLPSLHKPNDYPVPASLPSAPPFATARFITRRPLIPTGETRPSLHILSLSSKALLP